MKSSFDFEAHQIELSRLRMDRLIFLGEIRNWNGLPTSPALEKIKQQLYLCEFKITENEREYDRAVKKRIESMTKQTN